jgi:hypothetical protein
MLTEALPMIAKMDYSQWRGMIPELPATYSEWLLQHAYALAGRPDAAEIAITPAEFHRYWQRHGSDGNTAPDVALLTRCIAHMAFLRALPPSEPHYSIDSGPPLPRLGNAQTG